MTQNGFLPWTRSCFVCGEANPQGLRQRSRLEDGRVLLDFTPAEEHVGYQHLVHGGLGMTLLDEVMTWAAIMAAGRVCVAAEMATRFVQPMRVGEPLCAVGWVTESKRRLILTTGELTDTAGQVLLRATGKYVPRPAEETALCADDFVRDPAAIPLARIFAPT
ncbi:MAG: PaaI family thioesterase [Candidatus Marinimicrobia bacterium]|nr:PaaI family thioesterase [Candidatus Neomarinimicrobiota bacterium]